VNKMGRYCFYSTLKNKSGVTLIESIVAIFLTLTAFAVLFQMFSFGYLRIKNAKHRLSAIHLCQEALEERTKFTYDDLAALGDESDSVIIDRGPDVDSNEDDLVGTREIKYEPWMVSGETEQVGLRIIVSVSWEWKGKPQTEILASAISSIDN